MTAYNCINWMKLEFLSYLPTLRYLGCLQYFNSTEHIFILKGLMILRMIFLWEIFRISGLMLKICLRFLNLYYQIVSQKRHGKLLFLKNGLLLSRVTLTLVSSILFLSTCWQNSRESFSLTFHFFPVIFPPMNFQYSSQNSQSMHFSATICKSSQSGHVIWPIVHSTTLDIRINQSECQSLQPLDTSQ